MNQSLESYLLYKTKISEKCEIVIASDVGSVQWHGYAFIFDGTGGERLLQTGLKDSVIQVLVEMENMVNDR